MSKPLANPSTLDRRPQSCTSANDVFVEGLWSPSLVHVGEKGRLMPTHIHLRYFNAHAQESFSLRRGLDPI